MWRRFRSSGYPPAVALRDPSSTIVLVTGASRGLGAGIARVLGAAGYRLAVGYREQSESAFQVASKAGVALPVRIDVSDPRSVATAFALVQAELGEVDVLVNNAGIAQEKPFPELDEADWERMLSVNLLGAVRTIQAALPSMRARGFGRIVNVTSIGGQWGGMNQVHYAAAKAALINLTRSIAKLYSKDGITCNAIAPGLVATEMSAAELETPAGRAKVAAIPAGRLGTPEEVGAAVRYLVSPEAGYVTGQTLNLNGGMLFT